MWIASVIIVFIVFLLMYSDGAEEESIFVIAGLLLAVIVRMGSISSKLSSKYKNLEEKYTALEKEFLHGRSSSKEDSKSIDEDVHVSTSAPYQGKDPQYIEDDKPEVQKTQDATSQAEYFSRKMKSVHSKEEGESVIAKGIDSLVAFAFKGNPLVKVGGILLFFGLSFLIRFAAEKDMISIEIGLLSAIIFALVLIGIGWKYKGREGSFGLILQGTGIAVFYLSIFSSAKYFEVIPFSLALVIMIITVVFACFLALAQNSLYLALFATAGGFIAPIITSTGEGSHVVLFSYYALLNIGIIFMAWFKSWRVLNLTGFAFTFIVSLLWGAARYTPEFFWSTEPFLIFFFLLYVGVSVIFSYKNEYKLKAYVDATLLFGVPATAFAMQGALVKDYEYALSFSALIMAAFYLSLAWVLRKKEHMSLLSESFLALGVVFVTLAVPFYLSGHWTAVTWTLEATAIIWLSLRQDRFYARMFAVTLQVLAGGVFLFETILHHSSTLILNNMFLGSMIISIAALLTSLVMEKNIDSMKKEERVLIQFFMGLGIGWWLFSSFKEIDTHFDYALTYILAFVSISALAFSYLSKKLNWKSLETTLVGFFPLGIFILFLSIDMFDRTHPFIAAGWIAIPLFLMTHYLLLYHFQWKAQEYWHAAGLWLAVLVLSWELAYHVIKISYTLSYVSYTLLPVLAIMLITPKRNFWPLKSMSGLYQNLGLRGVALILIGFNFFLFSRSAVFTGIGYIPVFNPMDVMQIVSILSIVYWLNSLTEGVLAEKRSLFIFLGGSSISFLSVVIGRSVHFYAEVSYRIDSLLHSDIFQASISVLYSVLALILIIIAKRKLSRSLWIVGASLLGFVTFKLFFVELSHSGSLSRIVSFMAVGILILLIGYLAPLPPKQEQSS